MQDISGVIKLNPGEFPQENVCMNIIILFGEKHFVSSVNGSGFIMIG